MFKRYRALAGLWLCMAAASVFARTEVWFAPHHTSIDYFTTAFEPYRLAEWQELSYSVDVFKFYLGKFTTDTEEAELKSAVFHTNAQIRQAVSIFQQVGIKAAFELRGPLSGAWGDCVTGNPTAVGHGSAVDQANTLQAAYVDIYHSETGNTDDGVYALAIDGPVEATHSQGREANCTFNDEQSLQAFVAYVVEFHNRFPQAKIGITTNFPVVKYDGKPVVAVKYMPNWDYRNALTQMVTRAAAAGVTLDFLRIDHPADFIVDLQPGVLPTSPPVTRGNWGQLRDVSNQARSLGLRVNVIFNWHNSLHWSDDRPFPFLTDVKDKTAPPAPVTQTMRNNARGYATNSAAFAARWRDEAMPIDIATFQSWHDYPYSVFQSSAPQMSGTPAYDKYAAANIVQAVDTVFNRRICSPYEYKAQRPDLDAYYSQFSGPTLYANTLAHWNVDGAFERIGVSSDPFALYPRPVTPTSVTLCRTTPPDTCTEAEYFRRRPDVGAAYRPIKQSALYHWQNWGRFEGMCQPNRIQENCSVAAYFLLRPDVQADSGGNNGYASYHWGLAGRWEGMCRPY